MKFKDGVHMGNFNLPQMIDSIGITEKLLHELGQQITITSITDGEHMDGSKHYDGLAFDFRTRDLTAYDKKKLLNQSFVVD